MRATGQVSAHDHGLTAAPVAMLAGEQRLGVDVERVADQPASGEGENGGRREGLARRPPRR
jgi:hypothetical protein